MAANPQISLAQKKRELLVRSEMYRQTMRLELNQVQASLSWVPRSLKIVRTIAPLLVLAAPLAGFFFAKKKFRVPFAEPVRPAIKKSLLAKALFGWELF